MPGMVTFTKICGDATSDMVSTCLFIGVHSDLSAPNILSFKGEHVRYAPNRVMFYSPDAAKGTSYNPIHDAFFELISNAHAWYRYIWESQ
jgi:hypothetical protein